MSPRAKRQEATAHLRCGCGCKGLVLSRDLYEKLVEAMEDALDPWRGVSARRSLTAALAALREAGKEKG